jgi:hypothetical protein
MVLGVQMRRGRNVSLLYLSRRAALSSRQMRSARRPTAGTLVSATMPGTLDYSRPSRRVRTIRKKDLVVVVLFLCGLLALWRWRDVRGLYDAARGHLVERAAARYRQPADHVAYTDDADRAGRLLASDEAYFRLPAQDPALYAARPWADLLRHRSGNMPGVTSRYYATVFLHARHNPTAGTQLVVVQMSPAVPDVFNNAREFTFNAASLANRNALPWWVGARDFPPDLTLRLPRDARLTVFTGQPDPDDASRFTIGYTLDGVRHTIDGQLRDNGTVGLVVRE